jgi:hypothetical protein
MESFSLRVPASWAGKLNSAQVQRWLADFFQYPRQLPSDPGPGQLQISLSLPTRAVRAFSSSLGETSSVALRRLSALYLGPLPPVGSDSILPAASVSQSSPWEAATAEYDHYLDALGYTGLIWGNNSPPGSTRPSESSVFSRSDSTLAVPLQWWIEQPFEIRVILVLAGISFLFVFLFFKNHTEPSLQPSVQIPEFKPWMPMEP